ncbi:Protein kinase [uncultured virus]|nr:Protein kinase [uncultured virus]
MENNNSVHESVSVDPPRDAKYLHKHSRAGGGSYSVVYHATKPNGESCAVKRNFKHDKHDFQGALRELDINYRFNHPNVIPIEQISDGNPFDRNMSPISTSRRGIIDDEIHFIYPLARCNLCELISNPTEYLTGTRIKNLMVQILLGMEYIHENGYIHRDIKPENILIFDQDRLMIGDFGLSKPYHRYENQTPGVMTAWYRAPEVLLQVKTYGPLADMWSVGCVFHQMFSSRLVSSEMLEAGHRYDDDMFLLQAIIRAMPYQIDREMVAKIVGGRPPDLKYREKPQDPDTFLCADKWPQLPFEKPGAGGYNGYKRVVLTLLEFNPAHRRNATQTLDDPFFDDSRKTINEHRQMYQPNRPLEICKIHQCLQREWMVDLAIGIFNMRKEFKWYTAHKHLFQAINIFDRMLVHVGGEKKDIGWTLEKTQLYFLTCIYIAIKYHSVFGKVVAFTDIADDKYTTRSNMELAELFEKNLVRKVLAYKIYDPTPYDAMLDHQSPQPKDTDTMLLMVLYGHHVGMTPDDGYKYWKQHRGYYLESLRKGGIM